MTSSMPQISESADGGEEVEMDVDENSSNNSLPPTSYFHYPKDPPEDPSNPLTWQYSKLLEIYIFADKYASHFFRQAIFEIIQLRFAWMAPAEQIAAEGTVQPMESPWSRYHMYTPFGTDAQDPSVAYAYESLPKTSPLRRYIVDQMVWQSLRLYNKNDPSSYQRAIERLDRFPSKLIAEIALNLAMNLNAAMCKTCEDDDGVVDATDEWEVLHGRHCGHGIREMAPDWRGVHTYHEHKTDQEKEVCARRYRVLKKRLATRGL
ncbi:hypothetical protein Slin15195_G118350 [Septoria linicola]|uniref:Uncharacterized protein n=1 Tax=Septoria linicola TaxID=215465 RepID=A0A9Q9EP75_9PEZI|nr:hypothetical protein Slin14017_G095340 [Septoria linicola]USW58516.1 hypothetical protein Slin15195_G118350 [Septoria linicola]